MPLLPDGQRGGEIGILRRQVHQRRGEQQRQRRQHALRQRRQMRGGQQDGRARGEPRHVPRRGPVRELGVVHQQRAGEGLHRQRRQQQRRQQPAAMRAQQRPGDEPGGEGAGRGDAGLDDEEALRRIRQRRQLEERPQVAGAEQQQFRVELREQPQAEQHQAEIRRGAVDGEPRAQAMQVAAVGQRPAPVHARCRADHGADGIAGQVDVGGHAAGQEVLQRFQHEAEAAAGQRRNQGRCRDAQPPLQCRHQQEAERQVGEDVGGQVEAGVIARPGRAEVIEDGHAVVPPAGERVQAGVGHQQRIGDGEIAGERCGRALHVHGHAG